MTASAPPPQARRAQAPGEDGRWMVDLIISRGPAQRRAPAATCRRRRVDTAPRNCGGEAAAAWQKRRTSRKQSSSGRRGRVASTERAHARMVLERCQSRAEVDAAARLRNAATQHEAALSGMSAACGAGASHTAAAVVAPPPRRSSL
jgi:hypothetical protein